MLFNGHLISTSTHRRRHGENTIAYAKSHDQALVGAESNLLLGFGLLVQRANLGVLSVVILFFDILILQNH